jgi:hypothetical protein
MRIRADISRRRDGKGHDLVRGFCNSQFGSRNGVPVERQNIAHGFEPGVAFEGRRSAWS